ncbi:glutathione S-transferase family protein [Endozoicomonas sp. OPT23]|uniref:glutathione S-transferase family protein n=1 Tax=Endozoicomonas sp. OPT23 TaxID=2072845 RepID=UPI00129B74B9|nr:glutathione S-transferase family protein [Endozoicomonas sp. OPT23]MRI31772.1 glutathione S-transferase family protein [Endozoicomonas sp. OPT23]
MIKLYGSGQSRSFRAVWALEEAGLDYEYQHVKIGSPEEDGSRHPSYQAINRQGKVPTLVDGNLTLTESAAIVNYIAALAPGKQLMPADSAAAKAEYDEFCYFILTDLEQSLWSKGKHSFVLPEEHRIEQMLSTVKWEWQRSLSALDKIMEGREFAVGDNFTCADILLAQTINWADRFQFDIPQQYLDYRDRMYLRPACQRAKTKASP